MAIQDKNIMNRLYFIAGCMFLFALAVLVKLVVIQTVDGEKYRKLAHDRTIKNFTIYFQNYTKYPLYGSCVRSQAILNNCVFKNRR